MQIKRHPGGGREQNKLIYVSAGVLLLLAFGVVYGFELQAHRGYIISGALFVYLFVTVFVLRHLNRKIRCPGCDAELMRDLKAGKES